MRFSSGSLDKRILLQKPGFVKTGAQRIATFTTQFGGAVRADVIELDGSEAYEAEGLTEKSTYRIKVNYRSEVKADWRIKYNSADQSSPNTGETLSISSVANLGRNEGLMILANRTDRDQL